MARVSDLFRVISVLVLHAGILLVGFVGGMFGWAHTVMQLNGETSLFFSMLFGLGCVTAFCAVAMAWSDLTGFVLVGPKSDDCSGATSSSDS